MRVCGTLFPRPEIFIKDENGCHLTENHDGPHKFINTENQEVTWEYDFCGCEDCRTDEISDMCITYQVNEIKL